MNINQLLIAIAACTVLLLLGEIAPFPFCVYIQDHRTKLVELASGILAKIKTLVILFWTGSKRTISTIPAMATTTVWQNVLLDCKTSIASIMALQPMV
jgi:hypothetical protein